MNTKRVLSTTFAAILATGIATTGISSAYAMSRTPGTPATAKPQPKQDEPDKKVSQAEKDLVKVSEDAKVSMQDLHNARMAIFNGETSRAQTFVDAAITRIDLAEKESKKYALDIKAPKSDDSYVPFGVSLTELDAFEPSDRNAAHTISPKKHPRKDVAKQDQETLKLSEIDVALTTGMIPVEFAKTHIDKASSLLKEGLFYEANLALKAVDDAVLIQSFALEDVPKAKNEQAKTDIKKTDVSDNSKKG